MMRTLWRWSHLALAASSFLLLILAAVSGIILAFEPVIERTKHHRVADLEVVTLAQAVPVLKEKVPGVQEMTVDPFGAVIVKGTGKAGKEQRAYVNPATGALLGTPREKAPLFQWMTTLHRSLFLHETGRLLAGITSFILILISLSGIALVIQRQKGLRRFFAPIERAGFAQYYHVVFGRIFLFFILALAVTGAYLSCARYFAVPPKAGSLVREDAIKEGPVVDTRAFPVFLNTRMSDVQTVQFPFSDFPEDYFTVKLKDRELCVNQFTGEILAEQVFPRSYSLARFSLQWHTGRSGPVWAMLMAVSAAYILFFIYSGFVITWKRLSGRSTNRYKADESRIILLVGSENGSTYRFAAAVHRQLLKGGEKAYLTDLDSYAFYPKAAHLIVMTSTYGQGDPPANAGKFAAKLAAHPQQQPVQYSVVGFGARSYQHFCRFASEVDALLRAQTWATAVTGLVLVDEQSPQDFSRWVTAWQQGTGLPLQMPRELLRAGRAAMDKLVVANRSPVEADDTFVVTLKVSSGKRPVSGDLVAFYPKGDHRERLYSIGKVDGMLQLSVKLYENGLGSQYLRALEPGTPVRARIIKNERFHFPRYAPAIVMVSNGTGIAPFLGMISENRQRVPCRLYGGFRTRATLHLYEPLLEEAVADGRLERYAAAFSRDGRKQYVSDLLEADAPYIAEVLGSGGVVMICGSVAMQKDVQALLERITQIHAGCPLSTYIDNGQVVSDCY